MIKHEHPLYGRPLAHRSVQVWRYPGGVVTVGVNRLDMATRKLVSGQPGAFKLECEHEHCLLHAVAAELLAAAEILRDEHDAPFQPELPLDWGGLR